MKPFDYEKYLKNNTLLKEDKKQINEFLHIPLEIAADKIGQFVSKLNKKYMDVDQKIYIDISDNYSKLTDVRYAQFLEDIKKDLVAGKQAIDKYEPLKKASKKAVQLRINCNKNGSPVEVVLYVLDKQSGINQPDMLNYLNTNVFKIISKGFLKIAGNSAYYDISKLYPVEKVDGKETAKIANPADTLKADAIKENKMKQFDYEKYLKNNTLLKEEKQTYYKDKQSGEIVTDEEMLDMVDAEDALDSFQKLGDFDSKEAAQAAAKGGKVKENNQSLSGERDDDLFWDTASNAGLESSITAMKQAGFSVEDICGFIQSHWNRL